jgi:flap endonuclease-1
LFLRLLSGYIPSIAHSLKLIREHGSIEKILPAVKDIPKYTVPKNWIPEDVEKDENETTDDDQEKENAENASKEKPTPAYVLARDLFHNHEVDTDVELKWKEPQREELTKFLVEEAGFNPERVKTQIDKLVKAHAANRKPQARMDSFFKVISNPVADAKRKKRLADERAKKKQKGASKRKK